MRNAVQVSTAIKQTLAAFGVGETAHEFLFEVHDFAKLSFEAQIKLMSETSIFIGVHGAGTLATIMFIENLEPVFLYIHTYIHTYIHVFLIAKQELTTFIFVQVYRCQCSCLWERHIVAECWKFSRTGSSPPLEDTGMYIRISHQGQCVYK